MIRLPVFCLLTFAGCGLFCSELFSQNPIPRTIRNIDIERLDVFPVITGEPAFLYRWANGLHIVTKESVIRNELLFQSGDSLDAEILAESERKLRRLPYFGEVSITVEEDSARFADVKVITQDQWSTLISYILNTGGGRTIFGGTLEEFNFLGLGKQIYTEVSHEVSEGATFTLRYRDPQLAFSRWTTEEVLVLGPFIKSFSTDLIRPFYSLDTRWAGGIGGDFRDETVRLFDAGNEVSRLRFQSRQVAVTAARAFGSRFKKTRAQLSYRYQDRDFSAIENSTTTELPDDELIHALTLTGSLEFLDFVKEKRIDRFIKTEDLTLGSLTSLSIGRTGLPIPEGVQRFELNFVSRHLYRLFRRQYLAFTLGFRTLFERDTIASIRLRYYNRLLKSQTLACNFVFDYGRDLEASRQFLLGGDSGLRGYPARFFTGNKRLLMNLEDRIFTPLNILTVAIGGVVFVDAGHVWQAGESVNLRDLNFSVGFGLRLGYTKSPNSRVGRFDFGWAFNRGGDFGITIGVDQMFSIN